MAYTELPPYSIETNPAAEDTDQCAARSQAEFLDKTQTSLPAEQSCAALPADIDYSRDRNSNVICTDPLLEDPVNFSAFIQYHGAKPPELRVVISGSHWEETSTGPDRTDGNHVKESDRRLVTDFEFYIPLTSEVLIRRNRNAPPYFFTFKPDIHTYRNSTLKRPQDPLEEEERIDSGLSVGQHAIVQYLTSTHPLKEFRFEKVVTGWDMKSLKSRVSALIRQRTGYSGAISVRLHQRESYIYIRPGSPFSRIYRHPFTFVLRCILFPLGLLLLLLDYVYLGRYWQVLGAKYDLHSLDPTTGEERGMAMDDFIRYFADQITESVTALTVNETLSWNSQSSSSQSGPSSLI